MTSHARSQLVVSYDTAVALVACAIDHARGNGWAVAVVVVDPAGHVVASGRMDGVPAPVTEFASDKAYTAILGRSTREFQDRMASSRGLEMGLGNRPRLCAWDGGVPIREAGSLIGAIGVSGAAGPDDIACAVHAASEFGLSG